MESVAARTSGRLYDSLFRCGTPESFRWHKELEYIYGLSHESVDNSNNNGASKITS